MKAWEALKAWQEKGLKCRPKNTLYYDYPENWDCLFGEEIEWEVEEKPFECWGVIWLNGDVTAYKLKGVAEKESAAWNGRLIKLIEVKR